jgi:hypothetical protein
MSNKIEIINLVKQFLKISKDLLDQGKIDYETYSEMTKNKIEFLRKFDGEYRNA